MTSCQVPRPAPEHQPEPTSALFWPGNCLPSAPPVHVSPSTFPRLPSSSPILPPSVPLLSQEPERIAGPPAHAQLLPAGPRVGSSSSEPGIGPNGFSALSPCRPLATAWGRGLWLWKCKVRGYRERGEAAAGGRSACHSPPGRQSACVQLDCSGQTPLPAPPAPAPRPQLSRARCAPAPLGPAGLPSVRGWRPLPLSRPRVLPSRASSPRPPTRPHHWAGCVPGGRGLHTRTGRKAWAGAGAGLRAGLQPASPTPLSLPRDPGAAFLSLSRSLRSRLAAWALLPRLRARGCNSQLLLVESGKGSGSAEGASVSLIRISAPDVMVVSVLMGSYLGTPRSHADSPESFGVTELSSTAGSPFTKPSTHKQTLSTSPSSPSPREPLFCLCGFACAEHFMQIESLHSSMYSWLHSIPGNFSKTASHRALLPASGAQGHGMVGADCTAVKTAELVTAGSLTPRSINQDTSTDTGRAQNCLSPEDTADK
ncbi:uncharacterized protein [Vicugna pacos]|uniref:Uncharacterized protein n=1 Tax=Vicugna pacos TaxID=30538 RepID=A0ABM5CY56_VICPA